MPQNPLQPHDDNPDAWHCRLIGEVLSCYARREFEVVARTSDRITVKAVPRAVMRRMRRLIVKAGKEHAAYVVSLLARELATSRVALSRLEAQVADFHTRNGLPALDSHATISRLYAIHNGFVSARSRVGVLETNLESARSEARASNARTEAAEAECRRLRMLLNARDNPLEESPV